MAFNPSSYQGAISSQLKSRGALSRGMSSALSGQQKFKDFSLDEQNKYAKLQEKAGSVFSNWKRGLGLVAGLAATAMGLGPVAAGLMAGVSTATGGVIGKGRAEKELGKSKYFKGITSDMKEEMGGTILKDSLMSAAMAYGAGTLREAGATARATEEAAAAQELQKTSLAKGGADSTMDYSSLEGWVNPETGKLGTAAEYDALVSSRNAGQSFEKAIWDSEKGKYVGSGENYTSASSFTGGKDTYIKGMEEGVGASEYKVFDKAYGEGMYQFPEGDIERKFMATHGRDVELFSDDFVESISQEPSLKDVGKTMSETGLDPRFNTEYSTYKPNFLQSAKQNLGDVFRGGKIKYNEAVADGGLFGDKAKGIFNTGTSMMNMFNAANKGINRRR